jgi:hypothetical protein
LGVERWIRRVHKELLDCVVENYMCVGLDYEYTDIAKNVRQMNLPPEKKHRATILQLSVASETLVF